MAIQGLTHGEDGRVKDKVIKYAGKISTGWGPKEGPNKDNFPKQAGKYIFMKEETVNKRIGDKTIAKNKWVENKAIQKLAEEAAKSKDPRILDTVCLVRTPADLWESFLAMYNGDGLVCRGNGEGTMAKRLDFTPDGDREWKEQPCGFTNCPDYISGACKAHGVMNIYPVVDPAPGTPYKFTTGSLNTIKNIESSLEDIWNLAQTAHAVKQAEAGEMLPFDGIFGLKMRLSLKKKKSGGRDVFVTELVASKKFRNNMMAIINRDIERRDETMAIEGHSNSSLLENASQVMIEAEMIDVTPVQASLEHAASVLEDGDDE